MKKILLLMLLIPMGLYAQSPTNIYSFRSKVPDSTTWSDVSGYGQLGYSPQAAQWLISINGTRWHLDKWIKSLASSVSPTISVTSPITYIGGNIGITQATTSTNGFLSSTDWNDFNTNRVKSFNSRTGAVTLNYIDLQNAWANNTLILGSSTLTGISTQGSFNILSQSNLSIPRATQLQIAPSLSVLSSTSSLKVTSIGIDTVGHINFIDRTGWTINGVSPTNGQIPSFNSITGKMNWSTISIPTYTASNGIVKSGNNFALDVAATSTVNLSSRGATIDISAFKSGSGNTNTNLSVNYNVIGLFAYDYTGTPKAVLKLDTTEINFITVSGIPWKINNASPTNGQVPSWNGTNMVWLTPSGGTTTNSITFDNSNSGASSGSTFNGSSALRVSANTIGAIPTSSTVNNITNGTGFLKNNGSGTWSYDNSTYLTSYTETDPVVKAINGIVKSNGTIISAATAGTDYQSPISLTTTGTSGAATFIGNTLNIPQYAGTTYSAGTGLTLLSNTFSVNTSQNITTLSNLTTGGYVKTTSAGLLSSGAILAGDVPTLNQNTTGSAATLTTPRTIQTNLASTSSASFDGSANITPGVTGTLGTANGGTGLTSITNIVTNLASTTSANALSGNIGVTGTLPIANGGTGATTAVNGLKNLNGQSLAPTTNSQTSSYTVALTDVGNYVEYNSSSAGNITIPDATIVTWVSGNALTIIQRSTGTFTIVAGGGTTFINPSGILVSQGQGSIIQLLNIGGTSQWYVVGGGETVPTLSDGSVAFYSNTVGNLSQDNSNLFWNIGSARLGIGNNTPGSNLDIRDNTLNATPATTSGLTFSNTTAATSGSPVKEPPSVYFNGNAWNTTASASQAVSMRIQNLPVSGTTDQRLTFSSSLNGGSYSDLFYVRNSDIRDFNNKWAILFNSGFQSNLYSWINASTMVINGNATVSGNVPVIQMKGSGQMQQTTGGPYGLVNHNMPANPASGSVIFYNTLLDGVINTTATGTWYALWNNTTYTAVGGDAIGFYHNPTVTSITGHDMILKATSGQIQLPFTLTASGTTGNQTINKISGSVRIAAAGTSVTVTNSLVTANTIVLACVSTNDATAYVKNVVSSSGSFIITLGSAATSETEIRWWVLNY